MQTTFNTSKQSADVIENLCPVCGFEMEYPPTDYNICPSCGTEFGVNDFNSSVARLRENWLRTGPAWWSPVDAAPAEWNPSQQLKRVLTSGLADREQTKTSADLKYAGGANIAERDKSDKEQTSDRG